MHPSNLSDRFLSFLDGGEHLGFEDDGFNVHDVRTGKRVQQFGKQGLYALSPDGRYLATRSDTEQKLKIIDRKTGREVRVLDTGKGYYRVLAYSPDGRYLAVNSDDGLLLWDLSAGRIVRQLKGHPDVVGRLDRLRCRGQVSRGRVQQIRGRVGLPETDPGCTAKLRRGRCRPPRSIHCSATMPTEGLREASSSTSFPAPGK